MATFKCGASGDSVADKKASQDDTTAYSNNLHLVVNKCYLYADDVVLSAELPTPNIYYDEGITVAETIMNSSANSVFVRGDALTTALTTLLTTEVEYARQFNAVFLHYMGDIELRSEVEPTTQYYDYQVNVNSGDLIFNTIEPDVSTVLIIKPQELLLRSVVMPIGLRLDNSEVDVYNKERIKEYLNIIRIINNESQGY